MADIKSVGIVGAGQMGAGIAQVCASAGYQVRLYDVTPDRVEAGIANIARGFERLVQKGSLSQANADAAMKRIEGADSLAQIGSADIAIEAATENETVKKQIFVDLVEHAGKDTIFASNTSSISITRLASVTDRPERFIGLHFMNPVPVMRLVEIIRHRHRRAHLREGRRVRPLIGQDHGQFRGLPGLHRQPSAGADDQRGRLHPV